MDFLFILLVTIWIAVSVASKKKRKQEQEEAARSQAQARENAGSPTPATATVAPVAPVRSEPRRVPAFDPYFGGVEPAGSSLPGADPKSEIRRPVDTSIEHRMKEATQTRPRETMQAQVRASSETRHPLEASSLSGNRHTHMESSLTGIESDCPPVLTAAREGNQRQGTPSRTGATGTPAPNASAASPLAAFRWDVTDVTRGLILSEILGKPKALQKRA